MKQRFVKIGLWIALVSGGVSGAHAELNDTGDVQVWITQSLKIPMTAKWDLKGVSQFRYGDNASFFFAKFYQIQAIYKMLLWLDLSLGYRQMWMRTHSSLKWSPMYVPFFEFDLHGSTKGWRVSNRFRSQYVMKESMKDEWQFRDRLRIVTPWKFSRLCMVPYIDDELFFKKDEGFFQNRLCVGVTTPFERTFKSKIYYMLRSDKMCSIWRYQHVIGLNFAFEF